MKVAICLILSLSAVFRVSGGFKCRMVTVKVHILIALTILVNYLTVSGQHVHHKIHVPTRIKTIFHTKIIRVPEHHHYIREKEKPQLVKVPEHHHYFHEKEKEKQVDWSDYLPKDEEEEDSQGDYENEHYGNYGSYGHSVFKKHAPVHKRTRKNNRSYKKRKH